MQESITIAMNALRAILLNTRIEGPEQEVYLFVVIARNYAAKEKNNILRVFCNDQLSVLPIVERQFLISLQAF